MPKPLALIFAVAENGVIGLHGKLPWSEPEDRAHYERVTAGHAVVMGRRTWEELGVPLAGRHNIVVSGTLVAPPGVFVSPSLDGALAIAYGLDPEPFVIGGAALFTAALPRATRIYLTEVPGSPEGDTVFRFDRTPFRVTSRRVSETGSGLVFLVLDRVPA